MATESIVWSNYGRASNRQETCGNCQQYDKMRISGSPTEPGYHKWLMACDKGMDQYSEVETHMVCDGWVKRGIR